MPVSRSRTPALSTIVWLIGMPAGAPAHAQEIWLVPQQGLQNAVDRMDMFRPDAPWKNAASHTQVFKFYANPAFNVAPQMEVDMVVADLKRRGIAIALEAGVITGEPKPRPPCGGWGLVEGYGPLAMHEVIARKIKKAGGNVKYIAMDEPLWFGHYFKGGTPRFPQPGCRSSIDEVIKLIAPALQVYIREFPGVAVGEIEPPAVAQPNWQNDLTTWATDFRATLGRPLAFVHIDVGWANPDASQHLRTYYAYLQDLVRRRLLEKIGIIYNGNPNDPSDAAWVQAARDHVTIAERDFGLHPDQVVFQSWHVHPTHAMPETSPDTLTSLVNFYVARKSSPPPRRGNDRRQ